MSLTDMFDDCYDIIDFIFVALLVTALVAVMLTLYFAGFFLLAWGCEWALTHFVSINEELYWTGAMLVALLGLVVSVKTKSD